MNTNLNFKKKICSNILLCAGIIFTGTATHTAAAQTYDPYAVQVINNLIANNGLQATPNAPDTWKFATWNEETPKKIIKLIFPPSTNLTGDASFVGLTNLQFLSCSFNRLTKLDLTNCPQLQLLSCMDNYLTEIVLTNSTQLERIFISKNKLSKFDLTNLNKLDYLDCYNNNFTELDVRNCTQLKYLECGGTGLTELDVTNCTQLEYLGCNANILTELNLRNCIQLNSLNCRNNFLTQLDLTGLNMLMNCWAEGQRRTLTLYKNEEGSYSLPISLNNPSFENNYISYFDGILTSIDSTVSSISFNVETGNEYHKLSGTLYFNYSSVGIHSLDVMQFKIYLNPTNESLYIEYDDFYNMKLYDTLGKELISQNGKGKTEINISNLQKGVYVVSVISNNKIIGNTKIVKK